MNKPSTPSALSRPLDGGAGATPGPVEIPNFKLLRRIGGGSYGSVWLAQSLLGEYRAIKVVDRAQFQEERPYQREFEGIRRFEPVSRRHASLIDVLYAGEGKGFFYYVMELADDTTAEHNSESAPEGVRRARGLIPNGAAGVDPAAYVPKTLRWVLRQAPGGLPLSQCLSIAVTLADTVAYLHECGLVHRDIKPANVIFVHGLPKLADIGLVTEANMESSFVGTEGYVAPEGPGRPQADIYALGMVLYEMLTGFRPGEYPKLPDAWAQSPDRSSLNELNQVVLKACEPNLHRRYQTADEMRSELELLRNKKSLLRLRRLERFTRVLTIALAFAIVALGWVLYVLQLAKTRVTEQESLGRQENLLRSIAHAQLAGPRAGWVSTTRTRLGQLAHTGQHVDSLNGGIALLSGEDARLIALVKPAAASAACFSADGRALVSGAGASPALVIEADGQVLRLPILGPGPVCWSPQGIPLQFAAVSNRLVLREAESGLIRREVQLPANVHEIVPTHCVLAATPDGRLLAAALCDSLFVWDARDGTLLGQAKATPSALAFSPDGALLAAGDAAGRVRIYASSELTELAVLPPSHPGTRILSLAIGPDRSVPDDMVPPAKRWLLATADEGANIVIWDLTRRLPVSHCRGAPWLASALAFHPDGLTLASAGRNEAFLWDIASGKPLLRLPEQSAGSATALAFDREGRRLISGGQPGAGQGTVTLWGLEPHRGIHTLRGLASAPRKVWFSPDSTLIAALSDNRRLAVWNVIEDRLLFRFETPVDDGADQAGGCFDANNSRFALASGKHARLYDLARGAVLQRWDLPEGTANALQTDAAGRWLLLRREKDPSLGRNLWHLYELKGANKPALLLKQASADWSTHDLAFCPGGQQFLAWDEPPPDAKQNVTLHAFAAADGREIWRHTTGRKDPELRAVCDPTGRWLLHSGDRIDQLSLRRWSDFSEIRKLATLPNAQCEAVAPSGAECAGNGWFFRDNTKLGNGIRFAGDRLTLAWVSAFSPDGQLLAQGAEDGVVLVVDLPTLEKEMTTLRAPASAK